MIKLIEALIPIFIKLFFFQSRQRRYKEKIKKDPVKYEEYKQKKRANYHTTKKLVKDLTPKERYNARVIWKLREQNLRKNYRTEKQEHN